MNTTDTSNRLIHESSPYLLQHAHNPVDWHPWSRASLALAKKANKPILLSIGYSACHWCHVMAHESFEDPDTAAVMNSLFINIKVDREERPDLDNIYQTAHQLLNQRSGGWPLTAILMPEDQIPFFVGTYFPLKPSHGMPAFKDILQRVAGFYNDNLTEIKKQNHSFLAALETLKPSQQTTSDNINSLPLSQARQELANNFDSQYGGFGAAPKFPHPSSLDRLLRHWWRTQQLGNEDTRVYNIIHTTLHAMASGGLYDQLSGGFFRYSVDEKWMIPHFEKMLYDHGPLVKLYAEAATAMQSPVFARIADETASWIMNNMQSREGGYYSTVDADSEGKEGKYYLWSTQELKQVLTENEYQLAEIIYDLDKEANFEGLWHLNIKNNTAQAAKKTNNTSEVINQQLQQLKQKLLHIRNQRTAPARDDKILCAWNGLMIKGMASAGRRLNKPEFIHSAQRAVDFIQHALYKNKRLLATYKAGNAKLNAYLDDYVFLMDGLLELLQAQWRDKDLLFLIELSETVLEHYYDPEHGGFYFTSDDHERLFARPKPLADEAIPAGNGVAAVVFNRLGYLLGNTQYLEVAESTIKYSWETITQMPYICCTLLNAVEEYLYPPRCIIVRGKKESLSSWQTIINAHYQPNTLSLLIPDCAKYLPAALAERKSITDNTIAYLCEGQQCQTPVTDIHHFKKLFN